jgi:phosphomannomutase
MPPPISPPRLQFEGCTGRPPESARSTLSCVRPLKIGISGVRGVVGETFTPELVVGFAQAFGTYLDSGRLLVCRDTRPSGPMVAASVCAGLLASGCEVIDLGICPTPSLQLAVPRLAAQGGISITAGHNPAPWNALKFVRGDGLYLNETQAEELLDVFHQGEFEKTDWRGIARHIETVDAVAPHIAALLARVDVDAIRARRFKVAVDCCNGACSNLTPALLTSLGCEVWAINDDTSMAFPHTPEPRPDTMAQVAALVKAGGADVGFVHDSDGERLGLVDESGEPLSEEMTLPLVASILLQSHDGPPHASHPVSVGADPRQAPSERRESKGVGPPLCIVTNVSTTSAVDRVAHRYGARVIRTPVGQAYVSEAIVEHRAVVGGEGNGAVAIPAVHATHDSAAAIVVILDHLARTRLPLSALVRELPRLTICKEQIAVEPHLVYSALQDFREGLPEGEVRFVDLADGIKVEWPDGWVHVRASNTESIIRVIAEATEPARAREMVDWARDRLRV